MNITNINNKYSLIQHGNYLQNIIKSSKPDYAWLEQERETLKLKHTSSEIL
jgi:hypothetical protein